MAGYGDGAGRRIRAAGSAGPAQQVLLSHPTRHSRAGRGDYPRAGAGRAGPGRRGVHGRRLLASETDLCLGHQRRPGDHCLRVGIWRVCSGHEDHRDVHFVRLSAGVDHPHRGVFLCFPQPVLLYHDAASHARERRAIAHSALRNRLLPPHLAGGDDDRRRARHAGTGRVAHGPARARLCRTADAQDH